MRQSSLRIRHNHQGTREVSNIELFELCSGRIGSHEVIDRGMVDRDTILKLILVNQLNTALHIVIIIIHADNSELFLDDKILVCDEGLAGADANVKDTRAFWNTL